MTILPFVRHVFQCLEDTVGAGIDSDRGAIAPEDLATVVEDEQCTLADAVRFPISSVALRDLTLGVEVRQQRKMQVAVFGEGLVAPSAVYRNSQELSAMFAELGKDFIVKRHLVAADRAPIRRIESKDDRPSLQIAEREPLIGRDPQLEIGSGCAGGLNLRHSLRLLYRARVWNRAGEIDRRLRRVPSP